MRRTLHKEMPPSRTRLAAACVAILGAVVLGGCGDSGPDRIVVQGNVTFGGSPPPADGIIFFRPTKPAEGFKSRPGRARFAKDDGSFTVTSVQPGDGLVPGTYNVGIECWQKGPQADGAPGTSYVPTDYTPPELEIKVGQKGPVEYDLDIPLGR